MSSDRTQGSPGVGGDALEEKWTLVIEPKGRLFQFDFKELLHYRDLIGLLTRRDFVAGYKQTILGPLWFIVQPLITTLMYMFVFGNILKIGTDDIPQPLFYFSGTMLWNFFSTNLVKSSDTFAANSGLFGKIYFPRMVVPLSYILTSALTMAVQFATMLVFMVYYFFSGYHFNFSLWLLTVPLLVVQMAALGIGVGMVISAITTKYRDLKNLVSFGMSLLMYATPIMYPMSKIPAKWRWAFDINPISPILEMFRFSFLGSGRLELKLWLISLGVTAVVFWLGLIVFNRNERTFIDVI